MSANNPLTMSIRLNNELPSKHESWPNVGLLLGQRRRRWVNSKPTLGQRLMFAGVWLSLGVLGHLHRRIQELTDGGGAPKIEIISTHLMQLALICSRGVRWHAPLENFEI